MKHNNVISISVFLIVFGLLINPHFNVPFTYVTGQDLKYILPGIGTSLLASLLFVKFTLKKINKDEERVALFEKMGLVNFYIERHEITDRCGQLFKDAERIDITAVRLKSLLEIHEQTLNNLLLTKRVQIRILMPNPDSDSARTLEQLLGTKESIREGLNNVLEWEKRIKKESLKGTLEIRYSNKLIASMYQRIDNFVFSGPYMSKLESQDTYTVECKADGGYGKILTNYFEARFNESAMALKKKSFVIEFMGMPGAGKTSCVNLLKERYPEIHTHSNEDVPCFPDDTPFQFNIRLLESLNKSLMARNNEGLLILDRGLEDAKIWLRVHKYLNNLNSYESKRLENQLPSIHQTRYYKILFIQPPAITRERRHIERRIDEWALDEFALNKLYDLYKNKAKQDDIYFMVDATKPMVIMENIVLEQVEKIYQLENKRF